jgi:cyclic-di-GMP-binding protein
VRVLAAQLDGVDAKALRETADKLRDKLKSCALVLGTVADGKVSLIAAVTPDVTGKIKAGELVNFVATQVGGKGGGKPDMAMAGGSQDAYVKELRRFNDNLTDFSKDRLSVLMVLDEKSRDLQDTLVRQYLRNPRMSRAVESQLWHAIYSLYWEVARGYHLFVREFSRHAKKCSYENLIPLLTLRAIRNFGLLLKWRAVRYLQPGEKLWLRLHSLYRVAESEGFQQLVQQAYPEETLRCTCETTYIHALMLDLANSGTLYPRQIDLVDRWLFGWHASFKLENRLNADQHNFVVDLSVDSGPRRARTPDDNAAKRYWSTGTLLLRLEEIKAEIQRGTSPAMLGLSEDARTAEAMDLLKHLEHQWAALSSREQRRAPRIPTKRMLDVTHGLGNVLTQLKTASGHTSASPYDTGLDYMEANDVRIYGYVTEQTRERTTLMKAPAGSRHGDVERWVDARRERSAAMAPSWNPTDKDWLRVGTLVSGQAARRARHGGSASMRRHVTASMTTSSSVGVEILPSESQTWSCCTTPGRPVTPSTASTAKTAPSCRSPACGWPCHNGCTRSIIHRPGVFPLPAKNVELVAAIEGVPATCRLGNPDLEDMWFKPTNPAC